MLQDFPKQVQTPIVQEIFQPVQVSKSYTNSEGLNTTGSLQEQREFISLIAQQNEEGYAESINPELAVFNIRTSFVGLKSKRVELVEPEIPLDENADNTGLVKFTQLCLASESISEEPKTINYIRLYQAKLIKTYS
ncbi:UNKNOWN [Stylonychia lemnae]|uniref:Uncharacterized protein n=1 Tax=Stylonychia lemnae TaxID=5949 RepID=A0A078B0Z0_STYLE|nr:UNKNOWN [Stylonychia lemnae]|eukprot:CDW88300.1 UNKNOWN [Stylonychia lemnae]